MRIISLITGSKQVGKMQGDSFMWYWLKIDYRYLNCKPYRKRKYINLCKYYMCVVHLFGILNNVSETGTSPIIRFYHLFWRMPNRGSTWEGHFSRLICRVLLRSCTRAISRFIANPAVTGTAILAHTRVLFLIRSAWYWTRTLYLSYLLILI